MVIIGTIHGMMFLFNSCLWVLQCRKLSLYNDDNVNDSWNALLFSLEPFHTWSFDTWATKSHPSSRDRSFLIIHLFPWTFLYDNLGNEFLYSKCRWKEKIRVSYKPPFFIHELYVVLDWSLTIYTYNLGLHIER